MKKISFFWVMIVILMSCNQNNLDYNKTKSGLYYRFYTSNSQNPKPNIGDALNVEIAYTYNDTLLYSSPEHTNNLYIILRDHNNNGDLQEGLSMMHLDDSASFLLPADTIKNMLGPNALPSNVKSDDKICLDVKLVDFMTREEMQEKIEERRQKYIELAQSSIEQYIKENNIKEKPLASGLYYIEKKKGSGNTPKTGEKVQIHYVAKYLNGLVFDDSSDTLVDIVIGANQVFIGLEEGIQKMKKGGEATLIIPHELAFGEKGNSIIPPFTPLCVDVKLVNIKDVKTVKKETALAKEISITAAKRQYDQYLIDNNLTDNQVVDGLTYRKLKEGSNQYPVKGSTVKVHYIGKLMDGTIFDSSYDRNQPFEFTLGKGNVLPGWDIAVLMMSKGEKAEFVMSQNLVYRDYSLGVIKPYSNLIYEIELIDIK